MLSTDGTAISPQAPPLKHVACWLVPPMYELVEAKTMKPTKFNVFGRIVLVEKGHEGWRTYYPGNEGKRRPADFIIPDYVEDNELEQYLADLFHEDASPNHNEVIRL